MNFVYFRATHVISQIPGQHLYALSKAYTNGYVQSMPRRVIAVAVLGFSAAHKFGL